jgi:hypothetical protein
MSHCLKLNGKLIRKCYELDWNLDIIIHSEKKRNQLSIYPV